VCWTKRWWAERYKALGNSNVRQCLLTLPYRIFRNTVLLKNLKFYITSIIPTTTPQPTKAKTIIYLVSSQGGPSAMEMFIQTKACWDASCSRITLIWLGRKEGNRSITAISAKNNGKVFCRLKQYWDKKWCLGQNYCRICPSSRWQYASSKSMIRTP